MGFSVGSYAKVWETEDKGKFTMVKLTVSAKNKQTDKYETTFSGKVAFFGDAHACKPMYGQKIKILNCDVTNKIYEKPDGTKTYPINFSVFKYELQGSESDYVRPTITAIDDDTDVPF